LNEAGKAGLHTIVDCTPHRPIDLYQQIALLTSVNVVPSTGFYRRAKIPTAWASIEDEKAMEELMTKEIVQGIQGTSVRAGIMKLASESAPLTDWEKKTFRAGARVQKATGTPIVTHSGPQSAAEQHDILVRNGADPGKIVLSHMDVGINSSIEKIKSLLPLLESGSYFEVDTFGQEFYTSKADLIYFLRFYCDAGFANRLFISMDSNWHWENGAKIFEGGEPPASDPNASRRTFSYLMTNVVPDLLKSGFSQKEIDTFMIDNPRRYFCGA
jgi:phosphotriesterase-related protein